MEYDHIIIGGGIFGCYLALRLAELDPGSDVVVLEREGELLRRASYHNQARIHNGYHYPRSLVTGLRSRINFPRFVSEFSGCVVHDFDKLYAVASHRSKVTAAQFVQFCERIGSEVRPAPAHHRRLFDADLIEDVFLVKEYAFDAVRLRDLLKGRLDDAGIPVMTNAEAVRVIPGEPYVAGGRMRLEVADRRDGEILWLAADQIYNCTYSDLNGILDRSGLTRLFLRHEHTELALVQVPECLEKLGVTVMCGPFFSVMPFPPRGLHSLSHVSFTPHQGWSERPADSSAAGRPESLPRASQCDRMIRDAARYLPCLTGARPVDSLWEIKTILPQSDADDSRPILFKKDPTAIGLVSVLGGKVDNIYEVDDALREHLAPRTSGLAAGPAPIGDGALAGPIVGAATEGSVP